MKAAAFVFIQACFYPLFSKPADQIHEFILENGMEVFLLEDTSDALVHIELSVKAGFSSQTQQTNGFFKLYTNLVRAMYSELDDAQCNSDSSSYVINTTADQVEEVLLRLSESTFSLQFSDEMLAKELANEKLESEENAKSMAGFINSAIDSKVFSAAPWQHDSGIYPEVFKKTTQKKARTILNAIAQKWYIPKNSALFISGNINSERTLLMLRNSFGRFYSNFRTPVDKPAVPVNHQRKYVLHSSEISPDLTQLVIQYTLLDMEQCDLMALALGYEGSLFKQQVLSFEELNIPGDEYINVSAAHKKDSSRLIIQTLLQPPENKKKAAATNSFKQTQLFLKQPTCQPRQHRPSARCRCQQVRGSGWHWPGRREVQDTCCSG